MSGDDVERTPDGHHIVVDGRRGVPPTPRSRSRCEPSWSRSSCGPAASWAAGVTRPARSCTTPRWPSGSAASPGGRSPPSEGRRDRLAATVRALLRHRETSTICPSDAARVVGGEQWRDLMPVARDVARELHEQEVVEVQQGGERVDDPRSGARPGPARGGSRARALTAQRPRSPRPRPGRTRSTRSRAIAARAALSPQAPCTPPPGWADAEPR